MTKRLTARVVSAVTAGLLLAACGTSDAPAADPTVAPPADDGDAGLDPVGSNRTLIEPRPIAVVSGGALDGATAVASESATDVSATGSLSITVRPVGYEIGGELPALPTDDTGWVYAAAGSATAGQVSAVAAALGVSGEPVRSDDAFRGAWRVGSDDGSASSLWVSDGGPIAWNFSAPWSDQGLVACAVSVDPDGNESTDCPEATAPAGVPTAGEAEALARDLLVALGADPATVTFETFADQWFASVGVTTGEESPGAVRSWTFGFADEGRLQFASGTLGTPSPVGPFALIDLDGAVQRLRDGVWGGFGQNPASSAGGVAEPATADDPVGEATIEPQVEPAVVTLVDVEPDLWWAWDIDGAAWLLPAYRFTDAEGFWHVTPAVTDEYLIRADPSGIDTPVPVEPDGGIGDGAEPLPEPAPGEGANPAEPAGPDLDPEAALVVLEELIGFSIEEFTAEAEAIGFTVRPVMIDGGGLAVTEDYRIDRVNVVIEGPRVVAIESIG